MMKRVPDLLGIVSVIGMVAMMLTAIHTPSSKAEDRITNTIINTTTNITAPITTSNTSGSGTSGDSKTITTSTSGSNTSGSTQTSTQTSTPTPTPTTNTSTSRSVISGDLKTTTSTSGETNITTANPLPPPPPTTITTTPSTLTATTSIKSVNDVAKVIQNIQTSTDSAKLLINQEISKTVATTTPTATTTARTSNSGPGSTSDKERILINEVNKTLNVTSVNNAGAVTELHKKVETTLTEISKEKNIDTSVQQKKIDDAITSVEKQLEENKKALEERKGLDLFVDSDKDGVSDFDEVNIYGTDPRNESTTGGLSDGEKILRGLDPRAQLATTTVLVATENGTTSVPTVKIPSIQFENPTRSDNVLPQSLTVTKVAVTDTEILPNHQQKAKRITFNGKALPNTYVTLYIYSTPVIVTVKTNFDGEWTYNLDKELEDGHHTVYVAMVNNSGKVIARSNPIPFVKEAAAAELDPNGATAQGSQGFFSTYLIVISLSVLLAGMVVALIVTGSHSTPQPPTNVV